MAKASQLIEQATASRDMAKRARRLAESLIEGPDRTCLLRYAEELDEETAALENQATNLRGRSAGA